MQMAGNHTTKEQKDLVSNKLMLLLTVCFMAMLALTFIHRAIDGLSTMTMIYTLLRLLAILGVLMIIASVIYMVKCKREQRDESEKTITSRGLFIFSVLFMLSMLSVLLFHINAVKFLYVLLPMYAGLYLVYQTYPQEFFLIGAHSCVYGILFYVLSRLGGNITMQWVVFALSLLFGVLALMEGILFLFLMIRKRRVRIFSYRISLKPLVANLVFFSVLFFGTGIGAIVSLFLWKGLFLYGCYFCGTVLLAGAVYYTYRLMSK